MSTKVQTATVTPSPGIIARYAPLVLFSVLWLDLIRQLSYQWETNEQYAYGWFVPIFALALLWRRWQDRPQSAIPSLQSPVPSLQSPVSSLQSPVSSLPSPVSSLQSAVPSPSLASLPSVKSSSPQVSAFSFQLSAFVLPALCIFLCFLLLPLRVIHEINQDWPLITWPYTTIVVLLTLYAFFLADPFRSPQSAVSSPQSPVSSLQSPISPWLLHFAFPICFILVAVKWPYRIEHSLTQGLMQVVASITVEILNWIDIPALQHGNLIEISKGTLGVDEACSGIRSFQSTLMAGLLMGELYRLRLLPRAALVLIGLTLAFCFNVVRTFLLSYQAEKEGMSAIDKWHDPAGFTIAIATFLCLWAIAVFVTKRWSVKSPQSPVSGPQSTVPDAPLTSDLRPLTSGRTRRYLAAVGIWSLVCIGLTEAWYRSHHLNRADTAQWWVTYPTNLPSFQPIKVPPTSAKLLKHDMENGGSWTEPDGTKWSVFCFRWKEGDPAARMSAQGHRPEYCLVGSGHEMKSMSDIKFIEANGLNFPFRFYTFNSSGQPMHVFFCLWEDGAEKQDGFGKSKQGDRLRTVLAGRRGMGQQTLEIICTGYQDMEAAEKALRQRLPEIIRIEAQAPKTQAAAK